MSQQQIIDTTASPVIPPETGLALFDLNVRVSPMKITWDEEALDAALDAVLANYKDMVVTKDTVLPAKSEAAGLNKIIELFAATRKEIVAASFAPGKEWDAIVAAKEEKIRAIRNDIISQIKAFEDEERESRRPGVLEIINEVITDAELPDFTVPFDERWLNKSASRKDIRAAVESIVLKEKSDRLQAEQLERAKQDRITWVEQAVDMAGKSFGFSLPVARFAHLFELSVKMEAAQTFINNTFGQEQALRHRAVQPAPDPMPTAAPTPERMPTADDDGTMPTADDDGAMPTVRTEAATPARRVMNLQIAYAPSDFHALMRQLEEIRQFAIVTIHGRS